MASMLGGVAGAAIGSTFGGGAGAQMGWVVGSMLGSYLSAPDTEKTVQEGPRLDDLVVNETEFSISTKDIFELYVIRSETKRSMYS